ncbi:hypothetical protein QJS10_CPA02g00068 [Acorus calamus]|uniref:Uncharacterized protein n=1 Tax=Acorus calamus TaxID=4465 RepID=A0AAV9FE12_ACOCL|nr:hypothetical protein QJS10_CPA02g00068 [Acorus calamus]
MSSIPSLGFSQTVHRSCSGDKERLQVIKRSLRTMKDLKFFATGLSHLKATSQEELQSRTNPMTHTNAPPKNNV